MRIWSPWSPARKLRAAGAGKVITLLLSDDAVSGSYSHKSLTRWASRRHFERHLKNVASLTPYLRQTFVADNPAGVRFKIPMIGSSEAAPPDCRSLQPDDR